MRLGRIATIGVVFALCAVTSASFAALIGVLPGFPLLSYDSTGVTTYGAVSQTFTIAASPIAIKFSASTPPRIVNPTGAPPSEVVSIVVKVDNSGNLIGGVPGDDLLVRGQVDQDGNGSIDFAGVLLTGEVQQFGYLNSGAIDQYDFRFTCTGGLLSPFYVGKDIGVTVTSEISTFLNDFSVDFGGGAKGNIGPIDKRNQPPSCDANGPYAAECSGATTVIDLDGSQSSDPDMDALTYSWSSDCPNAAFDDASSPTPHLTVGSGSSCNIACTATLTVTDTHNSSSSCQATIHISDTNAPVIQCPADAARECSDSTPTGVATAQDDCEPNPTITSSDEEIPGDCPQRKTIKRTWTASDSCSNSASCVQTITIDDTTAPVITYCPPNITVGCSDGTGPSVTGQALATDSCDGNPAVTFTDVMTSGTCPIMTVITRTWKATDACGNFSTCTQTVTVRDTKAPTLTCPPDITIQCNQSTRPSTTGSATATDGCDSHPTITYCDSSCGSCPKIIRRTWKASDDCGNCVSCVQTITVQDTTPPVICCPPDVTVGCNDSTNPCRTGTARATDNCDTCVDISYTDSSSGCGCPRTIQRKWKAVDNCGNRSYCTQTITVTNASPCPKTCDHWKGHRSRWCSNYVYCGGRRYDDGQMMNLFCNKQPNGCDAGSDASCRLAKNLVACRMNLQYGSHSSIASTCDDADDFLRNFPPGCNPRGRDRTKCNDLADRLETYCNSQPSGCRNCGDDDNDGNWWDHH